MDMCFYHIIALRNIDSYFTNYKRLIILILCFLHTSLVIYSKVDIYCNDYFGYVIVNSEDKSVDLFKFTNEIEGDDTLLSSCIINENKKDYLVISTSNLLSEIVNDIKIDNSFISGDISSNSNSIIIEVHIAKRNPTKYKIFCDTCREQIWMTAESDNTGQIIYKSQIRLDSDCDYLHIFITPCINPFSHYSSFADSQTFSFVDLSIGDLIDMNPKKISTMKIEISDTIDEIFNRWVINKEYVIKMKDSIFWRGMIFERCEAIPK